VFAQDGPIQPGEAYVTRFSGTQPGPGGAPVINPDGTSGSIIDVRAPKRPPIGQHWVDEPQRKPVTAAQVGQVFGVALDDANGPNVYLTATSAFGLHRAGNGWMPGMWGAGGGPGTVYRLDASTGYAPRIFAQITLNGRANTGAALGNIAYDRANKQLFVSDLETGMIHRLRAADGGDLGFYDHGTQGRASFTNAEDGQRKNLPPIAFDPNSQARINDCQGRFDNSPQCWNFAASGRRVWGVGVRRDAVKGEVRLYYAVWSSPAFGQGAWNQASDDEKRNSVWSVRLGDNGGFDTSDVRREFILPDFFVKPQDVARAGMSQPVSDITFAECGQRPVMLIGERGGIRNLGLSAQNPFANPHEARALRYELDEKGAWRAVGRYDIGFYDRSRDGAPYMRANCAGGVAFGLGYDSSWVADPSKPDQFVWITGDSLCSRDGPCNLPATDAAAGSENPQQASVQAGRDDSEVHGLQGMAENAFEEVAPETAFANAPPQDVFAAGPNQSYLIDTDINVDSEGNLIEAELNRNDATKIGDVAIYQVCEPPQTYSFIPTPPPPVHPSDVSHARLASHGRTISHYRWGSHDPYWSHNRWGSHYEYWSHNRIGSHSRERTHSWRSSDIHTQRATHARRGSDIHTERATHARRRSDVHTDRATHTVRGSGVHTDRATHSLRGSDVHNDRATHAQRGSNVHTDRATHANRGSNVHTETATHAQRGSNVHTERATHAQRGSNVHTERATHAQRGSNVHTDRATHAQRGSSGHSSSATHAQRGSSGHSSSATHAQRGSSGHSSSATHAQRGSSGHSSSATHAQRGSSGHTPSATHGRRGSGKKN
jgi:hypothetical protein